MQAEENYVRTRRIYLPGLCSRGGKIEVLATSVEMWGTLLSESYGNPGLGSHLLLLSRINARTTPQHIYG